ncbi:membrane protein [Winogradskya consettensis]|uniref:Membrane protein n=1 Tax=Winogradskya consettensis TaxID=113560 RepID=A0A919SNF0_9ACTN|nr:hypothetical protein [Actinoplanes consettensis]GIM76050.1 membrane protein [Actinoplanes consettensis]
MSTIAASPGIWQTASALRRLYFIRAVFALVWVGPAIAVSKEIGPLTVVLFVLYPLVDAGAAIYDLRSSRTGASPALLYVNIAVSTITAIGLGAAAASGIPAMLRVWGAWAIVAGLVQLVVALTRRKMGGQWAMILSGGLSVVVGSTILAGASAADPSLSSAASYSIGGAIFFLVSAFRLGRAAKGN